MQDIIFKVMAVAIVLGGCVWGWWTENGPDKKDKKEAMEFKELTNDAEKRLSSLESEIIFKNKLRIPLQIKHSEITNTEATITCK